MPAGARVLIDVIVGTGISKSDSSMGRFLFIFLKNAQKMFIAIVDLPYNHANIFSSSIHSKCPKANISALSNFFSLRKNR